VIKKALVYTILITMTLHCASRLELLNYLYNNRHDIAFAIGLSAEKAIAMCSSDYSRDSKLLLPSEDRHPSSLIHAQEINLFAPQHQFVFESNARLEILLLPGEYVSLPYSSPLADIFHPPTA
jgi:hypothetical protein